MTAVFVQTQADRPDRYIRELWRIGDGHAERLAEMEIDARIGTPAKGWSVMLERKPGCKQAMVAWLHLGTAPVVPRDEFYEWLEEKP